MSLTSEARGLSPDQRSKGAHLYDRSLGIVADGNATDNAAFDADGAMSVLEAKFDGIDQVAELGVDDYLSQYRTPRQIERMGRTAKPSRRGADEPAAPSSSARRPTSRRGRPGSPPTRARRGGGGRRGGARANRYFRQTGIPGAASSATSLGLQALGIAVGLSLLNLALGGPGSKAFKTLLDGIGTALQLFIGPYDPLGGSTAVAQVQADKHPLRRRQAQGVAGVLPGVAPLVPGARPAPRPRNPAPGVGSLLPGVGAVTGK